MKSEVKSKKKAFWQDHIKKWEESGLSQSSYCKENQLTLRTFAYQRHMALNSKRASEEVNFVSIPSPRPINSASMAALQLMLPNGIRIGVSSELSESFLKMVLTVTGQMTC